MSQGILPSENTAALENRPAWNMASLWDRLTRFDLLLALPLITIVLLLENADDVWYLRTPLIVTCVIGLVYQRLLQATGYWFAMATLLGATVYLQWDTFDNHKYLFTYWCLGLACAYSMSRPYQGQSLAVISRLLLGLCMALAVIWKLATPDYVDGSFFEYTMLVDGRFAHFADAATDLPRSAFHQNQHLEALLTQGYLQGKNGTEVTLISSPQVKSVAWFLTWWTVLIEGLIAVAFLLPDRRWTSNFRNGVLLAFALTTYPIATVRGFGWMLMLLGMAQCNQDRDRHFRVGYLAAFLLIEVFTLPLRFMLAG